MNGYIFNKDDYLVVPTPFLSANDGNVQYPCYPLCGH